MERVNYILNHTLYRAYLEGIACAEKERPFCRHGFEHLLSVARITYMLLQERGERYISRELAYAAALLHDIGRLQEYRTGRDHAAEGSALAIPLLEEAGFDDSETALIAAAIRQHRDKGRSSQRRSLLSVALAEADSIARPCYECEYKMNCKKFDTQPQRRGLLY